MKQKKMLESEQKLREAGVRLTRRRVELAHLLFGGPDRHVTAEQLWQEARAVGIDVSLATVYNTLNELEAAGLLHTPWVELDRTVFDTNTRPHHHAVHAQTGEIVDLPMDALTLRPDALPPGVEIERAQLLLRVRDSA